MSDAKRVGDSHTQYFVHVTVSKMDLEHLSDASVRKDYDYVFQMAADLPLDEMSDRAIYRQIIGGLNNLVNGQPTSSASESEVSNHE